MRGFWKIWAPGIAVVLLGIAVAIVVMGPAPPKSVTIAGGSVGGAYAQTAERMAASLKEEKIDASVLTTAGSVDNLKRVASGEADIAIVQTGLSETTENAGLESLGGIFFEPLWIFHRADRPIEDLSDLRGMRVAVGADGSGSRVLADLLLEESGLVAGTYTPIELSGVAAAGALKGGEVDAALIVSSPNAGFIVDLAADPAVDILSLSIAPALSRRHTFLDAVTLYKGALDPARRLPRKDISMLAPSAEIVVRKDVHPALQSLLIDLAFKDFSGGSLLSDPGAFPNANLADIPLSQEARRYYKSGPTFLRRVFNYDLANFLERAWVLAIPLITLAYPLAKAAPPVYRWRTRRKIYVWYRNLRELEAEGRSARTRDEREAVRAKLAELQQETGGVEVPLPYVDDLYRLRAHIRFVSDLVDRASPADHMAVA
jgi:TRAP transporter TAXI family solute receptor